MAPSETPSAALSAAPPESPRNQTEVYAVHGADPEVLAYAMAKYSRSALSMKESLREISTQRAEHFLNTFYFQYGHRSIADLAHVAFAIERLSLLAAIILVDEQRWDGQERSTRYQNFQKSGWYLPDFSSSAAAGKVFTEAAFTEAIDALFAEYHSTTETMFAHLKGQTARPPEMKEEAYHRTLRARALDVSRYLLPLATNTSLGQIVNARTLETQISRLLSDSHAEVRQLGERLREAAAGSAWNVQGEALSALQRDISALDPSLGASSGGLADAGGQDCAHAGQVLCAQRLRACYPSRVGPSRGRADEKRARGSSGCGRSGRRSTVGDRFGDHSALWRLPVFVSPACANGGIT